VLPLRYRNRKLLAATGRSIDALIGASDVLKSPRPEAAADERFGASKAEAMLLTVPGATSAPR
jgi:hypothetical protein